MTHHQVEKYGKAVRILHWIHSGAFVLLFLTGLVFFVPGLGFLAENSLVHLIHRLGAAIFAIAPIVYLIINLKAAGRGLKQAFTWSGDDLGWLKAAPRYYLLGDESSMPPQDKMNTGQRLWWLITIVCGAISIITGAIMTFARLAAPPALLQRAIFIHDISFIVTGVMFLLHIYLGVFHPLNKESWSAITGGKISTEYARTHHGKWYAEIAKGKTEKPE